MGRPFLIHLEGRKYTCKYCDTPLGLADDIVSKAFQSHNGPAYLFEKVVNVSTGTSEERMMTTGLHTVVDIFCVECGSLVGWKY
ncbi:yippee family protein, partial [Genlisea aurea]